MRKLKNSIWGVLLIVIAIVLAIDILGIAEIDLLFEGWWTLFIIVPCAIGVVTERDKKGNIFGLALGICLLLACRDVIEFGTILKLLVPALLLMIGLSMIFKDTWNKKVNIKIKELNGKIPAGSNFGAFFAGEEIRFGGQKFEGTDVNAVFGGLELDLRGAIIDGDVVVDATAIFGGVDILLPNDVNVKIQSTSIFGGVDGPKNRVVSDTAPTLYINATAIFGGVDIK